MFIRNNNPLINLQIGNIDLIKKWLNENISNEYTVEFDENSKYYRIIFKSWKNYYKIMWDVNFQGPDYVYKNIVYINIYE